MKKFKKLIPALCMLLISAVLMGTSTYAWFSMNTTVKAEGMQVNAKTTSEFLQIVAGNSDASFKDDEAQTTATADNASATLKPIAVAKAVTADALTALDATATVAEIKWAEAFSKDPASSTKATNYNEIQSTNLSGYALINSFMVRMNPKTGVTESVNALKITNVAVTSTNGTAANDVMKNAVSVLFVCGENFVLYKNGTYITKTAGNTLLDKVTTAGTEIKVYIFFDGEDTVTTTNNATALGTDGYKVEFSLSI